MGDMARIQQTLSADDRDSDARQRADDTPALCTPQEISDYCTLTREIGHGNQGTVYLAERKSDGRRIAVKKLLVESITSWKEYELFEREAKVLANLDIEGVARCYGVRSCLDTAAPAAYLFQEYVEGKTLSDMIAEGVRFSNAAVFDISLQLLAILEQLHNHQPPIIHRDLKPSNVMASPISDGMYRVTLIDFGAVASPKIQSGGSTVAGTYGYMPPEQLMGEPTPASDYYALSAMIVQLLSGVEPVDMNVADFHLVIEPHLENMPNSVVAVLRKMLEPDQKRRLTDPALIKREFENFKYNRFDDSAIASNSQNISFDKELALVRHLGQIGNTALWQQLDEQTPRKIPKTYKHLTIRNNRQMVVKNDSRLQKNYTYLLFLPHVLGLLAIVIFAIYQLFMNLPTAMTLITAGIFFLWLFLITRKISRTGGLLKKTNRFSNCLPLTKKQHYRCIQRLLQYGKKTVAIIQKINYIRAQESEKVVFLDNNGGTYMCCMAKPAFEVLYSFNPPDDANEESLIHSIIIHDIPDGRIKPGDPLPILYYINPNNNRNVYSMPFPQPLNDIHQIDDIYCAECSQ